MKHTVDPSVFTHLNEEMAIQLAKCKTEILANNPDLVDVRVTDDGVEMSVFAAFDLLYQFNRLLWEETLDAFIDIAQAKFFEHHGIDPDSDHDHYLENGVDLEDGMISVLR